MKVIVSQNQKLNYFNLFKYISDKYPSIQSKKYQNIWNDINLHDIVVEYNLDFFNDTKIMEYNRDEYVQIVLDQKDKIKNLFEDNFKKQFFEVYMKKQINSFLLFKDYFNLLTLILKSSNEIISYLNLTDITPSMEEQEIITYLNQWTNNLDNTLDIYNLLYKDLQMLKIRDHQEEIIQLITNLFIFNYYFYLKYLIYLEFNDIQTFVKTNKLLSIIDVDMINLIDLKNVETLENDELINLFYKELNHIVGIILTNLSEKDSEKNIKQFIELKVGNIIYLYQLLQIINEIFNSIRYNININKNFFVDKDIVTDDVKLFIDFVVSDDYISDLITGEDRENIFNNVIKTIKSNFITIQTQIINEIDIVSMVRNELLTNFVNYIIPNFWLNNVDFLYSFYHSYFSKIFYNYRFGIKFNYFVDFNVELESLDENYFNLLRYGKTYYDLYLKYYFMQYYIIQDKLYVDLLNIIDDEYFYHMSENETMKTYLINLMSHLSVQTYLMTLQMKNLYNIDVTQLKYIKHIQNNYFGDINFDTSQSLSEQTNKFIYMFITKYSNVKGTKRIIYKILKILSQLTSDLNITNTNDYLQTTKEFDLFESKTYNRRLDTNIKTEEFYLSKIFNYDINTLTDELYKTIETKNRNIRKYIYSHNQITQRNILILQSKLFKGVDVTKLMTSNLSILQNYNDILEMVLIFVKQLLIFNPIYYDIFLEQLISDYNVTKLNFIYVYEILYSYYSTQEIDNQYKEIYNYQITYPYFVNREKYYIRYLKRYDETTGITNRILSPLYLQNFTLFKVLNNYTFQYLLKQYNDYMNLFENYHHNIDIVNNGYMFLPTNTLQYLNDTDKDNIITQINIYLNNVDSSVYKYVNYIKTKTYYTPIDNTFENSFYMNDLRYKTIRLVSNNFELLSDLQMNQSISYLNLYTNYDQYKYNYNFENKDVVNSHYESKFYLVMKPIITNSYNTLIRRVQYQQNTVTEKFYFNNSFMIRDVQELLNNLENYTRDELFYKIVYLLDNFGNSYNTKYDNTFDIDFYQELYYFVTTQEIDNIKEFINNMIYMNLIQYTQSHKNKTTDYTNPDSELYDVEYDEFGKLKNKLDQILVRLKSITPLNTNYFTDIFTQFYIENYNSLINKEMYYHPIVLNYNDERLNSNMNQYVFLYPKYRTVGLNKIVINDGYTYIDDSNHNFTQEKLVSISVPENKPVNDKLKLVNPVYRDIIETYETLGNDLYVYQDVYYGFGEYEIKPKFEISKYFLEIIDTSSNSDEFVQTETVPENLLNVI